MISQIKSESAITRQKVGIAYKYWGQNWSSSWYGVTNALCPLDGCPISRKLQPNITMNQHWYPQPASLWARDTAESYDTDMILRILEGAQWMPNAHLGPPSPANKQQCVSYSPQLNWKSSSIHISKYIDDKEGGWEARLLWGCVGSRQQTASHDNRVR